MNPLSVAEKGQLQEVTFLMHEIYLILARMRYLDYTSIHPGPYDLSKLLPAISSLDLDPRVLYLYNILPYISTPVACYGDFLQGTRFAYFRNHDEVNDGREFSYAEKMSPWITPLCQQGNHHTMIFYNARTHRIAIVDSESLCTRDHTLWDVIDGSGSAVTSRRRPLRYASEPAGW